MFATHGYAGASIRTIAKAAKVNVATLAYHFEDKDGLYVTVCQRLHEDLARDFPPVRIAGDARQTVAAIIAQAYRFMVAHRQHIQLLMRNVLDEGKHRDEVVKNWSEPLIRRAVDVLVSLRPDRSETEHRLLLITLMHTMARTVVEDATQHAALVGLPVEEAEAATIAWLQGLACRELGL